MRIPGNLEYNSFFLDDGVIAGRSPAVQQIVSTLEGALARDWFKHFRHRTEVVPACTSVQNFSLHDFEGCAWVPDGNIKLLGAAIGSQSGCEALLKRRVVKARNLLDAFRRYPDAQGAFTLLRSCSGWPKVLQPCKTVHPPLQSGGWGQGDQDIRHSLGRLVGSLLSDDDWRAASNGVANGSLGAHSALEHAPAACVSSLAQTQELCTRIWSGFDEYDLDGGVMRSDVESSLGAPFLPNAGIYSASGTPSQKSLSAKIEAKVCHHPLHPSSRERHRVAHLSRGAWLFALPLSPESHIPAPLFRVSLRRRLRMPIALFAARSWTNMLTTPSYAGALVM